MTPPPNSISGSWRIDKPSDRLIESSDRIDIRIERTIDNVPSFTGYLDSKDLVFLNSSTDKKLQITLDRHAGRLILNQTDVEVSWAGEFDIQSNQEFDELVLQLSGHRMNQDQLLLAIIRNFKPEILQAYAGLSIDLSGNQLWDWLRRSIDPDYAKSIIEAMPAATADDIAQMKQFGVSSELVTNFVFLRPDFNAKDFIELKRHGVSTNYATSFLKNNASYGSKDLTRLKRYGVPAQWGETLKGLSKVKTADDLVQLKRYGVTSDFIQTVHSSPIITDANDIVELRRYGVHSDFLNSLNPVDDSMDVKKIIHLRQYGITAGYYNEVKTAGNYTVDDIITLRRNGVKTDFVKATVVEGKTPMTVKAIVDLRRRGVSVDTIRELRN